MDDYWLIQDEYDEAGNIVGFKFVDVVNDETRADNELRRAETTSMNDFLPQSAEFLEYDYLGD